MSEYVEKEEVLKQIDCWLMTGEYKYSNATHYLDKRISSIKPKSEWISVKDRLPDKDGKYMVWYKGEWDDCEFDVCEFDVDSKTFGFTYDDYDEMNSPLVCWDDDMDKYVTHWRPLPEPPKEG